MPKDSNPLSPGDDRNLVVVDEDFAHADSEDRLWLFWQRYRNQVIGTVTAFILGLIAWFAYLAWDESVREDVRMKFEALADDDQRRAFAASHPGHPLAIAALLDIADREQAEGKGQVASYAAAAAIDPGSSRAAQALRWRARLYEGLLALEAKESTVRENGKVRLAELAEASEAPEALRGSAFLALTRAALAAQDTAGARSWLDKMDRLLGPNHPWRDEQRRLISSEPSLRRSVPAGP